MAEALAYLNGRFLPLPDFSLPLTDFGFIHGAVVVDNCRTWRGRLFRWPEHQQRFRRDCHECHVPLPLADDEITTTALRLIEANGPADLHVVTFATPGNGTHPTFGMSTRPVDEARNRRFRESGAHLEIVGFQPVNGDAVLPPRIKHRNRLHWHIAERCLKNPDAIAVLTNAPGGTITETAIAAVIAIQNHTLHVPLRNLILDSISLRVTLALAEQAGWTVKETPLPRNILMQADEVLLTGTGFGIAGVSAIDGEARPWPCPMTVRLMELWDEEVRMPNSHAVGSFRSE